MKEMGDGEGLAGLASGRRTATIAMVVASILVLSVLGLWWIQRRAVPTYQGMTAETVLLDVGAWNGLKQHERAIEALEGIGAEGLPYYVRTAYGARPWYSERAASLARTHPSWVTQRADAWINSPEAAARRRGARRALGYFSRDGKPNPVTNDLAQVILEANPQDVEEIADYIRAFGGDPVPVVSPWLHGNDSNRILLACRVIAAGGESGAGAIPDLVQLYQRLATFGDEVFSVLARMGESARPAFATALESKDPETVRQALSFAGHDPGLLEQVVPLLASTDLGVRLSAVKTMVSWRLRMEARRRSGHVVRPVDDALQQVVDIGAGTPGLLRAIDETFGQVPEFEQVRCATAYCLYAGMDNRFAEFLKARAVDPDRTKQVEARRALNTVRDFQQLQREGNDG